MSEHQSINISDIDLNIELFNAAQNNKLVIFAGTGVSIDSDIPNFQDLTDKILSDSSNKYDEKDEKGNYRFTSSERLERAEQIDNLKIRSITKEIIKNSDNGVLKNHESLLKFFGKDNQIRIVTTNFDLNFRRASEKLKIKKDKRREYIQPELPIGELFEGIVYLHGSIDRHEDIIITDKDFAISYLKHERTALFLKEVFANNTILFIGYSFNDNLLQFLVKSGENNNQKKFILIDHESYDKDRDKWKVLQIKPIQYNIKEVDNKKDHIQLWNLIDKWGQVKNRKYLKHRSEIKTIIKNHNLSKEEYSYLKTFLKQDKSLAKFFCKNAKTEFWIKWCYKEKFFEKAFQNDIENINDVELEFINWFASLSVEKNFEASFEIIEKERRNKTLNNYFILYSALAMHRLKNLPKRKFLAKWISITFSDQNNLSKDYLAYILLKCNLKEHKDEILILLDKLLKPNEANHRENGSAVKHWLPDVWKKILKPNLKSFALELESIISYNLHLHEINNKSKSGVINYMTRAAIEEHQYNHKLYLIDSIIDCARDLLDFFITENKSLAQEIINSWYKKNTIILKRLAIYGVVKLNLNKSEKFEWLIKNNEILNSQLRYENFALIKNIYPNLNDKDRNKLIKFAKYENYELYNFLEWLKESDPKCQIVENNLNNVKKNNPEFSKRDHPDLSSYMWSGSRRSSSAITKDEFRKLDNDKIINILENYQEKDNIGFSKRDDLIREFQQAVKDSDFYWSYNIAKLLITKSIFLDDVWRAILRAWKEMELDQKDKFSVFYLLLNNEFLFKNHFEISKFLSKNAEDLKKDKNSLRLAEKIRKVIFEDQSLGKIILNNELEEIFEVDEKSSSNYKKNPPDWVTEAINSSGYYLCDFYIKCISKKDNEELNKLFSPFFEDNSYSAKMGRIRLSHILNYFFEINEEWTKEHIFPLFDWEKDYEESSRSWQSYLYNGKWNRKLYPKLLELHKKYFTHFKGLGEARENYCYQISALALYSVIFNEKNPLETNWFQDFLNHCEAVDFSFFARGILLNLSQNEDVKNKIDNVWDKFLFEYLNNRKLCKPKNIKQSEFLKMLDWGIYLNNKFPDFIKIIIGIDGENNILNPNNPPQHLRIISDMAKIVQDSEEKEQSIAEITLHLLSKKAVKIWDDNYLKTIFQFIFPKISDDLKNKIRNESIKNGFDTNIFP
jgi:hypothetical protein